VKFPAGLPRLPRNVGFLPSPFQTLSELDLPNSRRGSSGYFLAFSLVLWWSLTRMSLNWVMLHDREGFVRLPNERLIYSSPPRTTLAVTPPPGYKGSENLSAQCSAGCIHLTNQRVRQSYALCRTSNSPRFD
jgi:hypothetical protein